MNIRVVSMAVEHQYLMKLTVEVDDGGRLYHYTMFPQGIDLVTITDEADQRASAIATLFGGGGSKQQVKDMIMPYSHMVPLMDLWHDKTETLRRMRDGGVQ